MQGGQRACQRRVRTCRHPATTRPLRPWALGEPNPWAGRALRRPKRVLSTREHRSARLQHVYAPSNAPPYRVWPGRCRPTGTPTGSPAGFGTPNPESWRMYPFITPLQTLHPRSLSKSSYGKSSDIPVVGPKTGGISVPRSLPWVLALSCTIVASATSEGSALRRCGLAAWQWALRTPHRPAVISELRDARCERGGNHTSVQTSDARASSYSFALFAARHISVCETPHLSGSARSARPRVPQDHRTTGFRAIQRKNHPSFTGTGPLS